MLGLPGRASFSNYSSFTVWLVSGTLNKGQSIFRDDAYLVGRNNDVLRTMKRRASTTAKNQHCSTNHMLD